MFIGHFAVGLGCKKIVPEASIATLFIACQLLDLIWPVLVLLGVESVSVDHSATVVTPLNFESYPYSHSLLASLLWAIAFGGMYFLIKKKLKTSLILAGVVFSHWLLDFLTHRPDLPILSDNSTKLGLSLWNSLWGTVLVVVSLFGLGTFLYLRTVDSLPGKSKVIFSSLISFLLVIYAANIFGPKPPLSTPSTMIAGPALAMWLIVLWGNWVEKSAKVQN